jgi:GPH family glycoside/pentoside/hexuronide:cation symporter/glucuronide carrier protein
MFFTPLTQPYVFIIVAMLTSPGTGMSMILSYAIQADNMDYIEWSRGFRAEGAVASLNSFIVKSGAGIGSAIGAYLLAFYEYVPNAEMQAGATIRGLYNINYALPAVFTLFALLAWIFGYPLTKKLTAQMLAELQEKRAQAEALRRHLFPK